MPFEDLTTPETDAQAFDINNAGFQEKSPNGPYVSADFARKLELELNAFRIAQLRALGITIVDRSKWPPKISSNRR